MGLTHTDKFTEEQNELAIYAKALGHPARIAILQHLLKANQCICGDLVDVLPLAQATISQHLKELKTAGIIQGNISGTSVCYCINPDTWQKMSTLINGMFQTYVPPKSCC